MEEDENEPVWQCAAGERTGVMMESEEESDARVKECAEDFCFSLWMEIKPTLESLEFETSGTTDGFCGFLRDGCAFAFKRVEGNVKCWFIESGWWVEMLGRQGEETAVTVPELGGERGKAICLLWATFNEPIGKVAETDWGKEPWQLTGGD